MEPLNNTLILRRFEYFSGQVLTLFLPIDNKMSIIYFIFHILFCTEYLPSPSY